MTHRRILGAAALFGMTAVMLGAFGAHALSKILSEDALRIFETGVRYQMYHALALLGVAALADRQPSKAAGLSAGLFTAGILLFSGSLYLLATAGWKWLGPVTPLGGACLIAGWASLAVAAFRRP